MGDLCRNRASYDSAIAFYNKAATEAFKNTHWNNWTQAVNRLIDCYRSKRDLTGGFRALEEFDSIAQTRINVRSEVYANILEKKAILLYDKGENEESNRIFQRAIALRKSLDLSNDTALALSYNGMGNNLLYLGKYDDAYSYYQQAIGKYNQLKKENTSDYAMFNQNAGIIHAIKGEYGEAERYFQLSLSINKALLKKNDPKLALVYLNLGQFFNLTGNDEKALELLSQSENIFKTSDKKSPWLASIYNNIGAIYVSKANYEKALSYYNNALALMQSGHSAKASDLLTIHLNIGFIYEKKEDYNAAKTYYLQGLRYGEQFLNSPKILRGLANISYIQKNNADAFTYYERALNNSNTILGPSNPETATIYLKYGEFCSLTGNAAKAIEFMNAGLNIYRSAYGDKSRDVAYAYLVIGNHFERMENYGSAIDFYQKSLVAGFKNFNSTDIFQNPTPDRNLLSYNQLNMVAGKASALYNMAGKGPLRDDYLKASAGTYSLAMNMIEMLRSTYQEEDSKLLIGGNEKSTVAYAIRTQIALFNQNHDRHTMEEAFSISEKGKSAVLLSYLRDMEAKNVGEIPDKLRKFDNKIKSDIAFYNKLLFEESLKANSDQVKVNLWNNTLFGLSRQHDSLIRVFESQYPEYYNLKYDNSVISLKQTSEKLAVDQALVEYTLSDSVMYIFVVTRNEAKMNATRLTSGFYTDLRTVREMLVGKSFNNYSPEDFNAFTSASYNLYQVLLQPYEDLIRNKSLIIIPDAELGYLSFDILLTQPPKAGSKGYRGLPYLIKRAPVSYAPSATALFEGYRDQNQRGNRKILAVAPSYDNIKGVKAEELMRGNVRGKVYRDYLLPIPGAQVEVANIRKILRSKVLNEEEATEARFKSIASDYSILHLAMHTIINNKNPLYSKLVFYHTSDTVEDGLLNTSELFGMQLKADLAVLSACNTGSGKLEKGEGIMSLSRGFFYAGVPSIIMTSWAVEDQSGSELMSSFYRYLAEGKPKNEALQLAKMDYLENSDQLKSHPHFWAAYMNIGDISSIPNLRKPFSNWIYYLSGSLLLMAAIGTFILIRRHRQRGC